MRLQGGGHIVNVTSPAGVLGVPYNAAYSATKAAMTGWTRTLQAEWAGTEILVTEYNPGLVATEMGEAAHIDPGIKLDVSVFEDEQQSRIRRLISRPLSADEVGAHIVDCVRRRRQIAYSTPGQALGMHLSEIPAVRRAIGSELARAMRKRFGIGIWTDEEPRTRAGALGSS
jgi:short-subunit dehydrogenase